MSYRVLQTAEFGRQSRRLARHHRSWPDDLQGLLDRLKERPLQGDALGRGCYKIRVAIAAKNSGKSDGARVITLVKQVGEYVLLLAVYDKSERANLAPGELDALLVAAGL